MYDLHSEGSGAASSLPNKLFRAGAGDEVASTSAKEGFSCRAVAIQPTRPCHKKRNRMQRYASLIGVKPEGIAEYERLHANTWPAVLDTIHAANIRNYSIFRYGNKLFAYFEYIGDDYAADMALIAA